MKTTRILGFVLAAAMLAAPVITTQEASARRTSQTYKKSKKKKAHRNRQANVSVLSLFANNVGKYPYEIRLLQNANLRARLIKMMGEKEFKAMESNFNVVGSIEFENGVYTVFGGQTHNAGCTNATITYDPQTNLLVVTTNVDCNTQQQYAEN